MESQREIYSAADVILKIIKNEDELEDDIEYPIVFSNAYNLLQKHDIIKSIKGKFVASVNFESAYEKGVQKFFEYERQKKKALRRRKNQKKSVGIAIFSSAAVAVAGYFYKKSRR